MQERFFVMPDDGMDILIEPLRAARHSIDIYVFTLSNAAILAALQAAAARGVQVRALVDRHPSGNPAAGRAALDALRHAGVHAQPAPAYFPHLHAKSYVVDAELALISSVNYLQDWQRTRDHGIITAAPGVVQTLAATFEADWEGHADQNHTAPVPPLVLSPNNSRSVVTELIASAQHSLLLEAEQITDPAIVAALTERSTAGVQVQLITNAAQEKNAESLAHLVAAAPGVRVGYSRNLWLHAKLLIADAARLLVGSVNLTAESLDQRREVSILTTDPGAIARATTTVAQDFAASSATPLDPLARPQAPADSPSEKGQHGDKKH